MRKILLLLFLLFSTYWANAQNSVVDDFLEDIKAGEFEFQLNKHVLDSLAKVNRIDNSTFFDSKMASLFKKNKKIEKEIRFLDIVDDINVFVYRCQVIDSAKTFIGTPYKYGGMTENGIDCSALILKAFSKNDYELPRTSFQQSKLGRKIKKKKAEIGDLIFFKTTRRNVISHVGIIVENNNDDLKFIHASSSRGVVISSLNEETYFKKKFAKIKRILE